MYILGKADDFLAGRHTFVFFCCGFFEPVCEHGGSNHPAAGTLEMAAKPFGTSRSRSEASIRKNPSEFLFVSEEEKSHSLYIIRDPRDFSATAPNYLRFEHPCCIFSPPSSHGCSYRPCRLARLSRSSLSLRLRSRFPISVWLRGTHTWN